MRIKLFIVVILFSVLASVARAQAPVPALGSRLSMELTFPSGGYGYYKRGAGMTAGVSVRIPLNRRLFFEPSLLFSYAGLSSKYLVKFDGNYCYRGTANLYTVRLPLELGYDVRLTDFAVMSVAAGPWLNFNLGARRSVSPDSGFLQPSPGRKINLFKCGWKRVDAQWGIRLSVTFAGHYYAGVSTGVAFTPFAKFGNRDKKIRICRNTVAVSLGYSF